MDYLNPGGVREELIAEMNLRLPDPMSAGSGGGDENETLGEARARAAAGYVIREWVPRALEARGLAEAARLLRQAQGDRETEEAAARAWELVRRSRGSRAQEALRDCVLRGLRLAGWMISLDQGSPMRRRWRRGRAGEEAALAGETLAAVLRESGEEPNLEDIYRELLQLVDRTPPGEPPYVVDLMDIRRTVEMDMYQFVDPDTPDSLVRGALYRSSRVLARIIWAHGLVNAPASLEELRDEATRHLNRPGLMVQAAVRNLPDPGPRGGFTNDLEVILFMRHAHEMDISSFIVEREREEEAALSARRMMEYHGHSQGP